MLLSSSVSTLSTNKVVHVRLICLDIQTYGTIISHLHHLERPHDKLSSSPASFERLTWFEITASRIRAGPKCTEKENKNAKLLKSIRFKQLTQRVGFSETPHIVQLSTSLVFYTYLVLTKITKRTLTRLWRTCSIWESTFHLC